MTSFHVNTMDMKLGGFLKYKNSKISNNLAIVWLSEESKSLYIYISRQ